ncbi:MAG TPA: M48 family metallopeptidase [Bacilli bacterium]|nr:M48 family metallopeptidase [Bacilli bacterium]
MKILLIALIIIVFIINITLKLLELKQAKKPLPVTVQDIYDEAKYHEWQRYQKDRFKVALIYNVTTFLVALVLFSFNLHSVIFNFIVSLTPRLYLQTLLVATFVSLLGIFTTIINFYETFVVEEKYGFNKTTKKLFIKDTLIKFVLVTVLLATFVYLLNILYAAFENVYIFLGVALGATVVLILLMPILQPLFSRLFNKMTPMEPCSLKDKIIAYAEEIDFPVTNIYVVDASKRSSKANAYFLGFGKKKRIVLFDTLIENLTEEEIVAVLAHEVGHSKHKHILKLMPFSLLTISLMLVTLFYFVSLGEVASAFNVTNLEFIFGLLLFQEIFPLIGYLTNMMNNALSRKYEYEADRYAAETYQKAEIISALKALTRSNMSNLNPHPLNVFINHSHPVLHERIDALQEK